MPSNYVRLIDVTFRDGIQSETHILPTKEKLKLLRNLVEKGVQEIQLTSFVHPKRVPQMADAELLVDSLKGLSEKAKFSALVLNEKGLDRAISSGIQKVDLSLSCSETHGMKNAGMGLDEAIQVVQRMLAKAHDHDLEVRIGLQCAFGCRFEGAIPVGRTLEILNCIGIGADDEVALADSTGDAHPALIEEIVKSLPNFEQLVLHLHDTKGLGLLNMHSALKLGIRAFDTSLGGLGGCPFIPGAGGNIATEDAVYLLNKTGFECGFKSETFTPEIKILEESFKNSLSSSMYKIHSQEIGHA